MFNSDFFLLPTNKLYKKESTKKLKNFPAGYVGHFYRNLADNIDASSDFYSRIAADADIPKEDVQKYILASFDFAKSTQTDINHYITRDRINDARFRQKLDLIGKNILRRQNPLERALEDISIFDAEKPVVGSLLREIDIKKKQFDSDFIRSLPSHPGKEFEIQKRLDNLRGFNRNNNNNNNNNIFENSNLFDGGAPPSIPKLEDFIDGGVSPFNTPAQNSVIFVQQNADSFQNRLEREKKRELSNIPKETVKNAISNLFDGLGKPPAPRLNILDGVNSWPPPPQPPSAGVATESLFETEKKKDKNTARN